jgi:RNA polymerase sigma factor (sigma-70 family)
MREKSDQELIKEIAKGSEKAFREIFERHKARVYGVCFYMLANRGIAEDISQETWLSLVEKAGDYQSTGSALGWILTVARNKCLNELRSRKKWQDIDSEVFENIADPTADLDSLFENVRQEQVLQKAILELSDNQRVILIMFVQEEKSISEIAQAIGSNVGAVKVQLHRARETLKQIVEDYEK